MSNSGKRLVLSVAGQLRGGELAGDRIGTSFHETFALNLPAIAAVLRVCDEHEGEITPEVIRSESGTALGPNYVTSMVNYSRGTGLLDLGSYGLTSFGHLVREKDPNLTQLPTMWLMHYHMTAPVGPGPSFWNHLITNTVRIGSALRRSDVSNAISAHLEALGQRRLAARTVDGTATAFLGTYQKMDGLGRLGLMEPDSTGGVYEIVQPETPPLQTFACALTYYWEDVGSGASEFLLKELSSQTGLAGIFCLGSGMLGAMLAELQSLGYVSVKRDAPPFVVRRHWDDPTHIRGLLYASH